MQQDNNNIENKLRQLDNQQLPDLSQMDEHWKSMQAMLQPTVPGGGKIINMNRWLWITGFVVLISAAFLVLSHRNTQPGHSSETVNEIVLPVKKQTLASIDSALFQQPVDTSVKPVQKKIVLRSNKNEQVFIGSHEVAPLDIQFNAKISLLETVQPDRQKMLSDLLVQLAKKAESFIIDNSRDTVLFAAEGSSLFIPANSLGGSGAVKISLREFYKTSDIVLNKLGTTSNQEQLITGGMVHISATVNDLPVNITPDKPIRLYLPDTSSEMEQMQLFAGEENATGKVNWISKGQNFARPSTVTEVRVLDIRNEPFKTIKRRKGIIGVFTIDDKPELSRKELKNLLKEKYGYYKVRFHHSWRNNFIHSTELLPGYSYSNSPIGDSAWVEKGAALKYKLGWTQSRSFQIAETQQSQINSMLKRIAEGTDESFSVLQDKYSVDINSLGWINCDRFYADPREKISYAVNLKDSAVNYYTMLLFDRIRSMMAGYPFGNTILFANVPVGEPVKIISIGINKNGEAVIAIKETIISKEELTGLQFEATAAATIKSSLSKMDN